jgi:hypothetical protein
MPRLGSLETITRYADSTDSKLGRCLGSVAALWDCNLPDPLISLALQESQV